APEAGAAALLRRGGGRRRRPFLWRHPPAEFRFANRLLGGLALARPQMRQKLIDAADIRPLPVNQRADPDNDKHSGNKLGEAAIGARRPRLPVMIRRLERTPPPS